MEGQNFDNIKNKSSFTFLYFYIFKNQKSFILYNIKLI
jgi:hypothetical protein